MSKPDISADTAGLQKAFSEYLKHSKRSLPIIAEKQATQLCIGAKGVKGLFQEALATRPDTLQAIDTYVASATYTGRGLKRGTGNTWNAEVRRRRAVAGYYQASGWICKGLPGTMRKRVITLRGSVSFRLSGFYPRIVIRNHSGGALEFGKKTGYIQRAIDARAADMLRYCREKTASDAKVFTRATAKTQVNVGAEMDRLLGANVRF